MDVLTVDIPSLLVGAHTGLDSAYIWLPFQHTPLETHKACASSSLYSQTLEPSPLPASGCPTPQCFQHQLSITVWLWWLTLCKSPKFDSLEFSMHTVMFSEITKMVNNCSSLSGTSGIPEPRKLYSGSWTFPTNQDNQGVEWGQLIIGRIGHRPGSYI